MHTGGYNNTRHGVQPAQEPAFYVVAPVTIVSSLNSVPAPALVGGRPLGYLHVRLQLHVCGYGGHSTQHTARTQHTAPSTQHTARVPPF